MIDSQPDPARIQNMNTGDSTTFMPRNDVEHAKLSSTMMSYPESSRSATGMRNMEHGSTLHLLSKLLGQHVKLDSVADFKGSIPPIPINDLRGEEATTYSREECIMRRSLAALYRLIDVRGWTHSIYNHISARSPDNPHHFLINPFGLLYHEIQASSLVKINNEGTVIQQGSTVLGVNKAGWTLHSAMHSARSDVNCIIHVHLPDVIAVSCIRAGLLPVCPEANELLVASGVKYHEYRGILVDEAERASIQSDLGPKAKILFLRNHGVAVAASSVQEAWYLVKRVVTACQIQMRMLQLAGGANLLAELKDTVTQLTDGASNAAPRPFTDMETENGEQAMMNGKDHSDSGDASWSPAELEFEAEMRVLDCAGIRTGHVYLQPNLLRRAPGSAWVGDTLADPIASMDLGTTDFSATEFSTVDDLTAAETAGAHQKARIADSVRTNRMKSSQRTQWLANKRDPATPGLITSSMVASPRSTQSTNLSPVRPSHSPDDLPDATPVRRQERDASPSTTLQTTGPTLLNGTHELDDSTRKNKSATLPTRGRHSTKSPAYTTHTMQSTDGALFSAEDDQIPKPEKQSKRFGSFRMRSFSRKKKQ